MFILVSLATQDVAGDYQGGYLNLNNLGQDNKRRNWKEYAYCIGKCASHPLQDPGWSAHLADGTWICRTPPIAASSDYVSIK